MIFKAFQECSNTWQELTNPQKSSFQYGKRCTKKNWRLAFSMIGTHSHFKQWRITMDHPVQYRAMLWLEQQHTIHFQHPSKSPWISSELEGIFSLPADQHGVAFIWRKKRRFFLRYTFQAKLSYGRMSLFLIIASVLLSYTLGSISAKWSLQVVFEKRLILRST